MNQIVSFVVGRNPTKKIPDIKNVSNMSLSIDSTLSSAKPSRKIVTNVLTKFNLKMECLEIVRTYIV